MQNNAANPSSTLDKDIEAFRAVLAKANRIVVLAGAGLSAGSGIPTFRGKGGLWRKHDVLSLSTPAAFIDNPSRIWQFHHYLRETMFKAAPNAAHMALARFTIPQLRHMLAPNASFTLITQNIDGLDRRAIDRVHNDAGLPSPLSAAEDAHTADGSNPVLIEMHGHIAGVLCTSYQCRHRAFNFDSPICPSLAGTELLVDGPEEPAAAAAVENKGRKRTAAEARAWAEARLAGLAQETNSSSSSSDPNIPVSELPRCTKCGALTRPDVVWFTEVPHRAEEVVRIVESADVCLVVGTSAVVHPAATFSSKVKERGGTVAIFNIEKGNRDSVADFVFLGPCEEILPKVLDVGTSQLERGLT